MFLAPAQGISWNETQQMKAKNGNEDTPSKQPPFAWTFERAFPLTSSPGAFSGSMLSPTPGQGIVSSFLQPTGAFVSQAPVADIPLSPDGSESIGKLQFSISDDVRIYDSYGEGSMINGKKVANRRVMIIVTATKENGDLYWKQAFYRSSGKNSGMPALWFPFYGIAVKVRVQANQTKEGEFYLSKGFGSPTGFPAYEEINLKGGRLYATNEQGKQLVERLKYRSFLLASAMIGMQGGGIDSRQMVIDTMKEYAEPKYVDSEIYRRILETNRSPDMYDKYYELNNDKTYKYPSNTEEEINEFIGSNLVVNFGRAPGDQISLQNISTVEIGEGRGKFPYVISGWNGYYLGLNKKKENIIAGLSSMRMNKMRGSGKRKSYKSKNQRKRKTRKGGRKQ